MFWEKINQKSHLITLIVSLVIIVFVSVSLNKPATEQSTAIGYSSETVKAQVLSIVEQGTVEMGDITQTYQIANLRILEGKFQGQEFTIDYGKRYLLSTDYRLSPNEKILVSIAQMPDGNVNVLFVDFVRTNSLLILGIVFVFICILVSGWKGVRSILGIGLSFLVIVYYIIPQIIAGKNPILVSLIGSIVFLAATQYLVYGWTLKTHIALSGILLSILFTGFIAVLFVDFARLNGMGDESAMYLMQQSSHMNVRNLLIAGIIIGSLGILDDLVIGQTSAVIEIYRADPDMSFNDRFMRSMNVGKDHIAATVNTLVLAYLGASLSAFLLFSTSNVHITTLLNFNYLAEEIVRSLVGTIGLFTAVPITTFIACWIVDDDDRLVKMVNIFGPLLNPSEIHHHH